MLICRIPATGSLRVNHAGVFPLIQLVIQFSSDGHLSLDGGILLPWLVLSLS